MNEKIAGTIRQVIGFLIQEMKFETDTWRKFEREVKALVAPHLPVLAHRRERLLDGTGEARWSDELGGFMERGLWPLLGDTDRAYAERNRTFVTLLLDVAIADEQRRMQAVSRAEALPLVRAFDANWAN